MSFKQFSSAHPAPPVGGHSGDKPEGNKDAAGEPAAGRPTVRPEKVSTEDAPASTTRPS